MPADRKIRRAFLSHCSDDYLEAFLVDAKSALGFFADKTANDRFLWRTSIMLEQQLRAGNDPNQLELAV